jgi:hypothetical protein
MIALEELSERSESLFDELIRQQHARVLRLAQRINPRFTEDDILQPQDYPALRDNTDFNYEDGILAGLRSAQIAYRARVLVALRDQGATE